MRISDWSSDVCSSDLHVLVEKPVTLTADQGWDLADRVHERGVHFLAPYGWNYKPFTVEAKRSEERRVGKELSVRVDLGGRRIIKKKKRTQKRVHKQCCTKNTNKTATQTTT